MGGLPGGGTACAKAQRFGRAWHIKASVTGWNQMAKGEETGEEAES